MADADGSQDVGGDGIAGPVVRSDHRVGSGTALPAGGRNQIGTWLAICSMHPLAPVPWHGS